MEFKEEKELYERLDRYIRLRATGNLDEFAQKLNISKRTLQRALDRMKVFGCPIYYCRANCCYCYKYEGNLVLEFKPKTLDKEEMKKIQGGTNYTSITQNEIFIQFFQMDKK